MPPASPRLPVLRDQLFREAVEMVRYAFASGKSVPTSVIDTVERYESHPRDAAPLDPAPLVLAHSRLTKIVSPATPRAIVILAEDAAGRFAFLGPVALVRQLMVVAVVCVAAFVAIGLFKATGTTTVTFDNTWGLRLLLNELWWLTGAGVGASFAILFQVNEYIEKSNYNPKYAPTYWLKFLLGVMAGYILVAMLPFTPPGEGATPHLMQPAFALLGGYSASAVYRILTRLVEAVESIFRGNARELIAEREQAAEARAAEEAARAQMRMASRLVDVLRQQAAGATTEEMSASIRDIVASLTPDGVEVEQPPAAGQGAPPSAAVTVAATPQAIVAAAGRAVEEPA